MKVSKDYVIENSGLSRFTGFIVLENNILQISNYYVPHSYKQLRRKGKGKRNMSQNINWMPPKRFSAVIFIRNDKTQSFQTKYRNT